MSCLDVMYPAYGHYAPYAPAAPVFINSFQAPIGLRSPSPRHRDFMMESAEMTRCPEGVSAGPGSSSSASSSSSYPRATRPEECHKEKQEVPEAEYLTSRCVLFTYYQGDISSVVDEHFSRALSSYMEGEGKRRTSDLGTDTPSPSSRRSFPPPSGTATTPPPKVAPTANPECPPIPWTPTLPDSARAFRTLTPILTVTPTRTSTHQRGGATPRARPTGPPGPSTNSTLLVAWSPTTPTAPCLCPPCGPTTWAPSLCTTPMTSPSWTPPRPGRACCPPERWPSTWTQASSITRKGRTCTGFNNPPPLPSTSHYRIQLGRLDLYH